MKNSFAQLGLLFALLATEITAEPLSASASGAEASPGLRDATILIIRHAEKPEDGFELSATGRQRAGAYVNYFKTLTIDSRPLKPDYLIATADSKASHRPRLTIEPLSRALGLKIDNRFKDKNFAGLAREIRSKSHGKCLLIAWHHGEIPNLLQTLGADAAKMLPDGKWPGHIFGWVLVLRYDHEGRLIPGESRRINENLMSGDAGQ